MKIVLDSSKSGRENASGYYDRSKKFKSKAVGAARALEETLKKIERERRRLFFAAQKPAVEATEKRVKIVETREKEWFERFHHFTTSSGFLVLGGRDASQNDGLVARHGEPTDYFFHADIRGASAVILKSGGKKFEEIPEQDLSETAQFAACYSTAWSRGFGSVDVYSVAVSQLSKHSQGEYVGKGGFVMKGERKWFRNTELKLAIVVENELSAVPGLLAEKHLKKVVLAPGETSKQELVKKIGEKFGLRGDYASHLQQLLPGPGSLA